MQASIKIYPSKGFLSYLARVLTPGCGEDVVVFPTRRAKLYFLHYLHRLDPRPKIPPRVTSIADLVNDLAVRIDPRPLLSPADQAWLLWELVRKSPPFAEVAGSFDRFFPWGLRLAEVLDQLEKEMIEAQNIPYPPEEELPPEARVFLEHLGDIQQAFRQTLESRGLITPGQRLRLLAENAEKLPFPQGKLHLVGFFMLTQAELRLFKHWLEKGATLWWRADPENLPAVLEKQKRYFGVDVEILGKASERPRVHFYEAPDVHHEIAALKQVLPRKINEPDEALILLCAAGHLIPLLYELPEDIPVNVTLGYPLFRTALAHLFLLFMEVAISRQGERLHVPTYLRLLKHPYLKGLKTPEGEAAQVIFHALEERLRDRGSPYLSPPEIEALFTPENLHLFEAEKNALARGREFLRWFHETLLRPWLKVENTLSLARTIRQTLSAVLAPRLETLREDQSPEVLVERAFLYALETELLPALEKVSFAQEPLRPATLFTFLKDLLRNVRAPFEGEPLVGLQVMGLLETRLLSFKKVFVLDANEGYLPSLEEINPLLPEGIKPLLGLPPREKEEVIERYHFFSLVEGAEEVHLFYQSAVSGKGEIVGKQMRSRYLERLLWEEEHRAGQLMPEKINYIPLRLHPKALDRPEGIPKGQAEKEAVEKLLFSRDKISATLFNTYLGCPARFYFRYLLGISPAQEVAEFDAADLGETIHQALEDYFKPYVKRLYVPREHNDEERLLTLFKDRFRGSRLYQRLGPERRFFVEETALFRLARYLAFLKEAHPEGFVIVDLEREFCRLWQGLKLYGRLDRLERRGESLYVLDYKTGSYLKTYSAKHLQEKLFPYEPKNTFSAEDLFDLQERLLDIQLFLYLFLTQETGAQNAVYLQLAAGKPRDLEKPLFPERYLAPEAATSFIRERFPKILEYLIRHMIEAEAFFATREDKLCKFCDFKLCCECARC